MKFKIKYADKIVGIFIIIALLSISVFLIFMGINQRWFAANYSYNTKFLSADGLKVGMPIKYKGFQIGLIKKVRLGKENNVEVDFYIYGEYIDVITPNTIIQKTTSPIGLGSDIIIHPGPPSTEHIPENSYIPSFNMPEAKTLIEAGLVYIETGEGLLDQLGPVVTNFNNFLDSLNKTLKGDETISTGKIIKNTEEMTTEFAGSIEKIVKDIAGITKNINILSANIANPNNSITALTKDNGKLYEQIDEIIFNLNKTMAELSEFTAYINMSKPQITGILEESRGALKEGTAVMEGLKNNPLLKKGITQQKEQEGTQYSIREEDF